MLYRKKIDISYKRYKSNFEKKIRFEEVEEEYNEIKDVLENQDKELSFL